MKSLWILLLFLSLSPSVFGSEQKVMKKPDWGYKKFPLVLPQQKDYLPSSIRLGKKMLKQRMRKGSGTHMMWGIEQLYSDIKLSKYIAVKKNVVLYGKNVIGGWRPISKGHVLHLKYGKSVTAYYTQGLTSRERFYFESQIRKHHKVSDFTNPLIQKAYAETTGPNVGTDPSQQSPASEVRLGPAGLAGAAAICMGERAIDASLEAGGNAIDAIGAAGQAVLDDPVGAARTAGTWVADSAVAAWNGAGDAIVSAWNGAGEAISSAWNGATSVAAAAWDGTLWDQVSDSLEKTKLFLQKSYTFLMESIQGFADLPSMAQAEILCDFGIQAAKVGVVSAIMAATGVGASLAGARVMAFVGRFAQSVMRAMPAMRQIVSMANLSENEKIQRIRDLLRRGDNHDGTGSNAPLVAANADETAGLGVRPTNSPDRLGVSDEDHAALVQANRALPDEQRPGALSNLTGRTYTPEQQEAIIRAHNFGTPDANGNFSEADLREKMRIMTAAGIDPADASTCIRAGLCGRYAGPYNPRSPDANWTVTGNEHYREGNDLRYKTDRRSVETSANNFRLAGDSYLQAGDIPNANRSFEAASDRYAEAFRQNRAVAEASTGDQRRLWMNATERQFDDYVRSTVLAGNPRQFEVDGIVTRENVRAVWADMESAVSAIRTSGVHGINSDLQEYRYRQAMSWIASEYEDILGSSVHNKALNDVMQLEGQLNNRHGRGWDLTRGRL